MCRSRGTHCRDPAEDFDGTVERKCWDIHKKVRTTMRPISGRAAPGTPFLRESGTASSLGIKRLNEPQIDA